MSEHAHQVALFTWSRLPTVRGAYPGIDLLEASLNGVKLSKAQAGKAKAAGMLKGALDINLPVARGPYNGLRLELKYGRNKMTEEQEWYAGRLKEEGWRVETCWSWIEARDIIIDYLSQLDLFDSPPGAYCGRSGSESKPSVTESP